MDTRRHVRGEEHGRAVLTEATVIRARRMKADGQRLIDIASKLKVSKELIEEAIAGRTWSHLPGAVPPRPYRTLSAKQVTVIRRLIERGWTDREIADKCNSTPSIVNSIRHNRCYRTNT